jgi:tetratricopeptide (TPR) repeat protein
LTQVARSRHAEPLKLISQLRGDLDWIVIRALEKDRARRYQTVNGLALDVQRYLNNEPVVARPPSRWYRLQKLVHRNKVTFVAIAAVSVALVAGFGTSTWLFFKEREARHEAEKARSSEARMRGEADARAVIAQAALLMSRDKTAEADELMSRIEIPVIQPSLEAAGVFRRLGEWNVTQGRWPAAADRFLKLVQANQVDKTDKSEQATWDLLRAGPTLIAAGEMEPYRQFIQATLAHFAGTADPVAAEQIIKISLLLPADAATVRQLEPFAKVVEESMAGKNPGAAVDVYRFAWRAFSLSLLNYRRGDYADAVIWGQRCLNSSDQTPSRIAMTHVILAMSYAKLDQPGQALSELAAGCEAIHKKLPNGLGKISDLGWANTGLWHDWVVASTLLNEAEGVVK